MNHYLAVLKKYAVFSGRSPRSEFWYFVLFNFIIAVILEVISYVLGDAFNILGFIYSLAVIVPFFAVGARRLHDIGKSGWWQLVGFMPPIVGTIWLIVQLAKDSDPAENKYGPNPKGAGTQPAQSPTGQTQVSHSEATPDQAVQAQPVVAQPTNTQPAETQPTA